MAAPVRRRGRRGSASDQFLLRDSDHDVLARARASGPPFPRLLRGSGGFCGRRRDAARRLATTRALRLVREWAELHSEELLVNWNRARDYEPLVPIEPLA